MHWQIIKRTPHRSILYLIGVFFASTDFQSVAALSGRTSDILMTYRCNAL